MFIPATGSGFLSVPDPGSRGQKSTGFRLPDPQHCNTTQKIRGKISRTLSRFSGILAVDVEHDDRAEGLRCGLHGHLHVGVNVLLFDLLEQMSRR
jgi:hypothetical protein